MSIAARFSPLIRGAGSGRARPLPCQFTPLCHRRIPRLSPSAFPAATLLYSTSSPPEARPNASKPNPNVGRKRLADFDLAGRTFVVTGGAQGLGISLAEALVEAGGKVYCLDRAEEPGQYWHEAQSRIVLEWGGSLLYRQVDVTDTSRLNQAITAVADENQGIHGVIAAAGIQQVTPAVEYKADDVRKMLDINYTGVLMTATAAARQMVRYGCHGSICMIASISGGIANRGLITPVYNSSKAAVVQLGRNLAMEWAEHGIRVNSLSPGHMITPMVKKNLEQEPELEGLWKHEIMLGRLADPNEFKGAALFLLSNASSFMTGGNLVVDGGHTAW